MTKCLRQWGKRHKSTYKIWLCRTEESKKIGIKLQAKNEKIKEKSDAKTSQKTRENLVNFAPKTDEFIDKIQQNA